MGGLRSVLFVCHGNICRSPYAAAAFRRALPISLRAHVHIDSAGFVGPGRRAPEEAQFVAESHGLDLSAHRSQLLPTDTAATFDLIVVMEPEQLRRIRAIYPTDLQIIVLGDLDPQPIDTRTIRDPFGQAADIFEASYSRIDRCIDKLVSSLYEFGPPSAAVQRAGQQSTQRNGDHAGGHR